MIETEEVLQQFEANRGSLRPLADHELLTLVARLATEYVVRMHGSELVGTSPTRVLKI
jgi:hypothetical protein